MDFVTGVVTPTKTVTRNEKLWTLARDLEASFLAEMMKAAGVGKPRDTSGFHHFGKE